MILEYLTSNKCIPDITDLDDFKDRGILYEMCGFNENKSYITTFEIESNDEKSARNLSDLNTYIISEYKPTTLTNECAEYFNVKLYPLINKFERKLRKLLYIHFSISSDKDSSKLMKNLENLSLGKIFSGLFVDRKLNQSIKNQMLNKKNGFSKKELLNILCEVQNYEENTIWSRTLGSDKVDALVENYNDVNKYRNNVMHAYNISYEEYEKIEDLYIEINIQLQFEIDNIVSKDVIDENDIEIANNLSEALNEIVVSVQPFLSEMGVSAQSFMPYDNLETSLRALMVNQCDLRDLIFSNELYKDKAENNDIDESKETDDED